MNASTRRARAVRFTPWLVLAHDAALSAAVMAGVLVVRYHFEHKPPPGHLVSRTTLVFTALCTLVFLLMRQHRTMWRFTTLNEVLRIAQGVVVADLLLLPILFVADRAQDFPRSTPLMAAPILIVALAFGRVLAHALSHGDLGAAFKFEGGGGGGGRGGGGLPDPAAPRAGGRRPARGGAGDAGRRAVRAHHPGGGGAG